MDCIAKAARVKTNTIQFIPFNDIYYSLSIGYTWTIYSPKEKEKDKEQDKEKEKDKAICKFKKIVLVLRS